jgi:hypothetical protein
MSGTNRSAILSSGSPDLVGAGEQEVVAFLRAQKRLRARARNLAAAAGPIAPSSTSRSSAKACLPLGCGPSDGAAPLPSDGTCLPLGCGPSGGAAPLPPVVDPLPSATAGCLPLGCVPSPSVPVALSNVSVSIAKAKACLPLGCGPVSGSADNPGAASGACLPLGCGPPTNSPAAAAVAATGVSPTTTPDISSTTTPDNIVAGAAAQTTTAGGAPSTPTPKQHAVVRQRQQRAVSEPIRIDVPLGSRPGRVKAQDATLSSIAEERARAKESLALVYAERKRAKNVAPTNSAIDGWSTTPPTVAEDSLSVAAAVRRQLRAAVRTVSNIYSGSTACRLAMMMTHAAVNDAAAMDVKSKTALVVDASLASIGAERRQLRSRPQPLPTNPAPTNTKSNTNSNTKSGDNPNAAEDSLESVVSEHARRRQQLHAKLAANRLGPAAPPLAQRVIQNSSDSLEMAAEIRRKGRLERQATSKAATSH